MQTSNQTDERAFALRVRDIEAMLSPDEQAHLRSRVGRFTASERGRMLTLSIDYLLNDLRMSKAISDGKREIEFMHVTPRSAAADDDERGEQPTAGGAPAQTSEAPVQIKDPRL